MEASPFIFLLAILDQQLRLTDELFLVPFFQFCQGERFHPLERHLLHLTEDTAEVLVVRPGEFIEELSIT